MAFDQINYFSAILLVSKDAKRLAEFYKDILKVPLKDEQHDEEPLRYGCELGGLHFAIHPASEGQEIGLGASKLAFEVFAHGRVRQSPQDSRRPITLRTKKNGADAPHRYKRPKW